MAIDWQSVRAEFPAIANWTFLNTATFGQLPVRVSRAVAEHFARRDETACSDFLSWFDDADRIRASLARLIHCQPGDIAFVPAAASALSLLLGGLDWQPGDRIVSLEDDFPDNLYYPALCRQRGVEFVEARWDRFYEAITPRTRLVAISEVNYTNGFRPPLAELAAFLHERGVLLYVDGTQSLGALTLDAGAIGPDMYAVHAYKWMLSPNGAGFMYVRPSLRERLQPNVVGWRSDRNWRQVDNLRHGAPEFSRDAEKYEGGMLPFAVLYGMGAAVDMLLELGPEAIEQRVLQLSDCLRAMLRRLGASLPCDASPHFCSPIVAARFEGADASSIARELKTRRVLVSARHNNLRISTHFYNDEEDLARLEFELKRILPTAP